MILLRITLKTAIFILILFSSVILFEVMYFAWISVQASDRANVDAIVVFSGSKNRIKQAYDLASQGTAPFLIISPATRRNIRWYEKQFGEPGDARYIIEDKAETTFTNALYSARLIKEKHFTSVLLVTADYHMPRSYFLLKLATLTTDCRIDLSKLDTRSRQESGWQGRRTRLKASYNEMVQLWGSLIEGGLHFMGGSNAWLRKRSPGVTRWLREHMLFEVPCLECG